MEKKIPLIVKKPTSFFSFTPLCVSEMAVIVTGNPKNQNSKKSELSSLLGRAMALRALVRLSLVTFVLSPCPPDKGRYYVILKKSILQEDKTIPNVFAPETLKMHETKTDKTERRNRQTHNYGWRFQHFFLSNRTSRQKISKNRELNNTINLLYIIDIYRHYSKISEYIFFKCICGAYTNIEHNLCHKIKLKKCKRNLNHTNYVLRF